MALDPVDNSGRDLWPMTHWAEIEGCLLLKSGEITNEDTFHNAMSQLSDKINAAHGLLLKMDP